MDLASFGVSDEVTQQLKESAHKAQSVRCCPCLPRGNHSSHMQSGQQRKRHSFASPGATPRVSRSIAKTAMANSRALPLAWYQEPDAPHWRKHAAAQ